MGKKIIAILGDEGSGCSTVAKSMSENGFVLKDVKDLLREFAAKLFSEDEMMHEESEILKQVKQRGTNIFKGYWLNFILMSIAEDDFVVIDGLDIEELDRCKNITKIEVYREGISTNRLENVDKSIENKGNLKLLEKKAISLAKSLKKKY